MQHISFSEQEIWQLKRLAKPRGEVQNTQKKLEMRSDYILLLESTLPSIFAPEDFSEYVDFSKKINEIIVDFFEAKWTFKDKHTSFKRAFSQGNQNIFMGTKDEKQELLEWMFEKNILYRLTLFICTLRGKLDMLLTVQDKNTLLRVLESEICTVFDSIYLGFKKSIPSEAILETFPKPDALNKPCWVFDADGKIVPYNTVVNIGEYHALTTQLSCISDTNFRDTLLWIYSLIQGGVTAYASWVENEWKWELQSWENPNSNIALLLPMEHYEADDRAIDPELSIMLKKKNELWQKNAVALSQKYFWTSYGVETTKFYYSEALMNSWDVGFAAPLGKNFPNDYALKDQYGTYIFYSPSGFYHVYGNALPYLQKLLGEYHSPEIEKVKVYLDAHVEYHEYGHNLFLANHWTNLEEAKPSLFHDLKLYDENMQKPLTSDEIRPIIDYMLVDMMRDIERHKNKQFHKYVTYTRIVVKNLFASGVLSWEGDRLVINSAPEKYSQHLQLMKQALDDVQKLYALDVANDASKSEAPIVAYIQQLETDSKGNFEKMARVMGVL